MNKAEGTTKKGMALEAIMCLAIREFRRKSPRGAEIRNIYVQEGTGCVGTGWKEATFAIEYCKEYGGEYASAYVSVNAETGETRVEQTEIDLGGRPDMNKKEAIS